MSIREKLALDLDDIEIDVLEADSGTGVVLESLNSGHGMTEITASVGPTSCSCASCCLACCCCG